jgi:methyl-accepting chemotaxis protein
MKNLKNITIKSRLFLMICIMSVTLAGVGMLGLGGIIKSNEAVRTVYEDRTIALGQISEIEALLLKNRLALAVALITPAPEFGKTQSIEIEKNLDAINKTWDAYLATYLTPEEKKLADKFGEDNKKFINEGLKLAIGALRAHDVQEANRIAVETIRPLYVPVAEGINALGKLQKDVAKEEYVKSQNSYTWIRNVCIAVIVLSIAMMIWAGLKMMRAIVDPLQRAIGYFHGIAEGKYDNNIVIDNQDEIGEVLSTLQFMQNKLNDDISKARVIADQSLLVKLALNRASANVMIADNELNIVYQ